VNKTPLAADSSVGDMRTVKKIQPIEERTKLVLPGAIPCPVISPLISWLITRKSFHLSLAFWKLMRVPISFHFVPVLLPFSKYLPKLVRKYIYIMIFYQFLLI
jgi:hypothetical protein